MVGRLPARRRLSLDHPWQDRLARRRNRAGLARRHRPVALLETWMRLGRVSHGPLFRAIARKNGGAADRQACRPPRPDMRARRRLARRSDRGRAAGRVRRPFAPRRARLLRPDRGSPRAKASRPRQRRNDPPLPAQARPVHDQPHQGGGALEPKESKRPFGVGARAVVFLALKNAGTNLRQPPDRGSGPKAVQLRKRRPARECANELPK
jgi:hypothetical protein